MASYNRITIIGNLGRDPESRTLPSGESVTEFSVAVSERYRDRSGDQKEETTWFRCSAFGKLAQTCAEYLLKGSSVLVEGPLKMEEWTDKEGHTRTTARIRVREMRMLTPRGDNRASDAESEVVPFGELPF